MKHAREDYNRIQDPAGLIGEDEPVFLLRAKDITAPATLDFWAKQQRERGGSVKMAEMAEEQARRMRQWGMENGTKLADL